jgi:hypothetical protein
MRRERRTSATQRNGDFVSKAYHSGREKLRRLIFPVPLQFLHLRLNKTMRRTNPRPLQYSHFEAITLLVGFPIQCTSLYHLESSS